MLEGVTRATILELASKLDIPCSETDLSVYDLMTADEVFVTSVTPVMIPISKISNRPLKNPGPGPVIRKLQRAWSELVGVDIVAQALSHLDSATPAGRGTKPLP